MRLGLQLTAAFLLSVVLGLSILGAAVLATAHRQAVTTLQEGLLGQARLIGQELATAARPGGVAGPAMSEIAARAATATGTRVTLVAGDGSVLADSARDPTAMENLRTRPEVAAALAGQAGRAVRPAEAGEGQWIYAAVPAPAGAGEVAAIRLALPLAAATASTGHFRDVLLANLGLALLMTFGVAWVAARRAAAPLADLGEAVARFGRGELATRAEPQGAREIADLARGFNAMADRLQAAVNALQSRSAELRSVLDNMGNGVIAVDEAGRVSLLNRAAERLFGVAAGQALGVSPLAAFHNAALDDALRRAMRGEPADTELEVRRPAPRYLRVRARPIAGGDGGRGGAVAVVIDNTEARRVERLRRQFVADVSHELRTPLAGIRALAESLAAGAAVDPAHATTFVAGIIAEVDRLTRLVEDLLDLATIESGRATLRRRPVAPAEALRQAVDAQRMPAERKGIELRMEVPAELPDADADPDRLAQVLRNLLDNAVKFTPPGGTVTVSAAARGDAVVFEVRDTGPGMPLSEVPRVFERFYRIDPSRARELGDSGGAGGTGLGLAIVKHLAEAHGGRAEAESEPGKGSTFRVFFPRARGFAGPPVEAL